MNPIPEAWNRLFLREECRRFAGYWLSLQKDGLVPLRRNLNPNDIRDLLPFLMMMEQISDHEFRFRLVGTAVVSRIGHDSTGRIISVRNFDENSSFTRTIQAVLSQPCGYYVVAEEIYRTGLRASVELLGFPLASASGKPKFIATLSHECSKKYSEILHDSAMNEMRGQVHHFLDIGAGTPPAIGGAFTYSPRLAASEDVSHTPMLQKVAAKH